MSDQESDRDSIADEEMEDLGSEMNSVHDSDECSDSEIDQTIDEKEDEEKEEMPVEPVEQLKTLLSKLANETKRATHAVVSKDEEIREHCVSLRTKVDAQSEVMIAEIRQWNVEMRSQINEYEKDCLDKFNIERFEASASAMKSLLADINEHQSRIEQQIKEASSDADKVDQMIQQVSAKFQDLKKENLKLSKQKFCKTMLDLVVNESNKIKPSGFASLIKSSMFGFDSMQHLRAIKDMPGFKSLAYCFINPFAETHELIALVKKSGTEGVIVRMDASGKIVNEKPCKLNFKVHRLQAAKDCFIVQDSISSQFKRFDYNFNELETGEVNDDYTDIGFTANEHFIINPHINEDYHRGRGPRLICLNSHDYEDITSVPDDCQVDDIAELLASDKYLYIWHGCRVRVVDIKYGKPRNQYSSCCNPKLVDDRPFKASFSDVKLLGDQNIAIFNNQSGKVTLYTQDSKVELVREYKVGIVDHTKYTMSNDGSNGFCFFNSTGDIYHTLI